uniref:Uncharacterized protein n=1 Tax=Anguilla anguilla TaxID=7936 RepID=A0A0E9SC92_ANGAN
MMHWWCPFSSARRSSQGSYGPLQKVKP